MMSPCAMFSLLAVASSLAATSGLAADMTFENYVKKFSRDYEVGSSEYSEREALFRQRKAAVAAQNARPGRLWKACLNEFTDRTSHELTQYQGLRFGEEADSHSGIMLEKEAERIKKPLEAIDWTNLSMAYDVPTQGKCGSCWAMAAATMLQGRKEAQGHTKTKFSAQQLVNCVPNPKHCGGTGGCDGNIVQLAMQYIQQNGLKLESELPYKAEDDKCMQPLPLRKSFLRNQKASGGSSIGLRSWSTLPKNKAKALMQALIEGPVAISVLATPWFSYESGIFDGCEKDAVIDHAVALFGYGQEGKTKYWKIRNSWGRSWGEDGYIRLFRHNTVQEDDRFCGEDTDPSQGTSCMPYPKSVRVCGMCGMLYDSVVANFDM